MNVKSILIIADGSDSCWDFVKQDIKNLLEIFESSTFKKIYNKIILIKILIFDYTNIKKSLIFDQENYNFLKRFIDNHRPSFRGSSPFCGILESLKKLNENENFDIILIISDFIISNSKVEDELKCKEELLSKLKKFNTVIILRSDYKLTYYNDKNNLLLMVQDITHNLKNAKIIADIYEITRFIT